MSTPVTLRAAGLTLDNWDALTVTRSLDEFVDAFSFSCQSRADLRSRIKPMAYTPAEVYFGDRKIITGKIEKPSASMASSALNFEGRSLAGAMVDCQTKGAVQFGNQTLYQIGRAVAGPFGVKIRTPALGNPALGPVIVTNADEGAAAFLQRCATDTGYLWHSDTEGHLVIDKPTGKGSPVARLVEGNGLLLDVGFSVDGTALFSEYTVTIQVPGWPNATTSTALGNPVIPYRPLRKNGSTSFREVEAAAQKLRSDAIVKGITVDATVGDWTTDDGLLWEPGQIIELTAPSCWIDKPFALMVAGVTLTLSAAGRRAVLRLVLPGSYSGQLPEVWPWD